MKVTFTSLLFLLFLGLKLTGYIAWSWIWVTAPLWIPLVIALVILIFAGLVVGVAAAIGNRGTDAKKT